MEVVAVGHSTWVQEVVDRLYREPGHKSSSKSRQGPSQGNPITITTVPAQTVEQLSRVDCKCEV
jgi:hypothetical protein